MDIITGFVDKIETIVFHVGAWEDFGYDRPPTPESKTIPPLGQRSAHAVKASQSAIKEIDELIAELHQLRARLVSERRQDQDIRMARPLPEIPEVQDPEPEPPAAWLAGQPPASAGWSTPPALDGYGYVLPEDYLNA